MKSGESVIKELTLGELCNIVGLSIPRGFDAKMPINKVHAHSELCGKGSAVFVTYYGAEAKQGEAAISRGAAIVFMRKSAKDRLFAHESRVVGINDPISCTTAYLRFLRKAFNAKVVTVTGSIGKTTTVDMAKCVLGDAFKMHSHHSMTNSRDGIMRTIQNMHDDDEIYLQEVGAAEPGYVESSAIGLCPDAVIITNICEPHLDMYKTLENILADKVTLIENMREGGIACLDMDDALLNKYESKKKIVHYSLHNPMADYHAENIRVVNNNLVFDIVCKDNGKHYPAKLHILGDHNIRNALAVFAVGRHLGIKEEQIIESLGRFTPTGIRQNLSNVGGYQVFMDAFNAAPNSFIGSIKALESATLKKGGRRIVVVGDFDRLGDDELALHRQIGEDAAKCDINIMYCFGRLAEETYKGAKAAGMKYVYWTDNRETLREWIRDNITRDDITLYKGGQLIANLAKLVDDVYGTTFSHENQRVPRKIESISSKFRMVGEDVEYYHLDTTDAVSVDIPGTYNGKPIRRISPSAFSKCRALERVYIPDSVVNIGNGAFYICPMMKDVHLPENLKIIERSAFNYCRSLRELVIPEGTISIDTRAFYDCNHLEKLIVPKSVGYIGNEAFANCPVLTVYVAKKSYALEYCRENDIPYVIM